MPKLRAAFSIDPNHRHMRHASLSTMLNEYDVLVHEAQAERWEAPSISRLGKPGPTARDQSQWLALTATIALYRYRYDITGPQAHCRMAYGKSRAITYPLDQERHQ